MVACMEFDRTLCGRGPHRLPLQRKGKQLQQQRKHTEPRGCIITQRFVWMTSQCGRKGAHGERSVSRVPKPFGADDLSGEPTEHARRRRSKTGPTLPYAREKSPTPWIRKSMAPIYPSSVYRKTKPNSDEGKATHHQHGRVRFGRSFTLFEGESPFQIAHATLHPSSSKGYYPVLSCSANRPAKVGAGERGQTLISTLSKQQGGTPLTSKNSTKLIRSVNSCNAPTRPSSAIVPPIRDISKQMAAELSGKMARPQTAGPGIPSGSHPLSSHSHQGVVVHRGGEPLETEFEEGLDTETGAVQRTEIGAARPGKVSVAVKLPVLMSPDETGDGRLCPACGPTYHPRDVCEERVVLHDHSSLWASSSAPTLSSEPRRKEEGENEPSEASVVAWRLPEPHMVRGTATVHAAKAAGPTSVPAQLSQISFSTVFTRDESELQGNSRASFQGKALVGSRPAPLSRKLSLATTALQPGGQSDVDAAASHPLSPTSTGSPPRQHRNFNWGQEGTRLAPEEEEKSRSTVPFVVSSTLLGWKLSTRARKKTFEEALEDSDYSNHHPIPVYGFRVSNTPEDGEREERRRRRCRLGARALAAERSALNRRARADGGSGGVGFARVASRSARAKAEWIRKMGDVPEGREAKLCKGSTPQVIKAYRTLVRGRVQAERSRQRALRGLPLRRPPRMVAVTTRAELGEYRHPAETRAVEQDQIVVRKEA